MPSPYTVAAISTMTLSTGIRPATDRIAQMYGAPLEEIADRPQPDIPVGRIGRVEEFADVACFLCSERASYVSGVNLLVDGGLVRSL